MKRRGLLKGIKMAVMAAIVTVLLSGCGKGSNYIVLDPKGPVGQTELHLIWLSIILSAIVVIPVILIMVYIVIRYRDKPNNNAPYNPEWKDSRILEIIWWTIPIIIIGILGTYTVKDTYKLTKPPVKDVTPVTIQVTSLDWKWLFEYPKQGIATVNYAEIPTGVPIQFELTADAPMNSFWIPQLGGQEYTMPGMKMRLWLQADEPGKYFGSGANFTGKGYAHMHFYVTAKPQADFNKWVDHVKSTAPQLTKAGYMQLRKQGLSPVKSYSSFPRGLFDEIINKEGGKYMHMKKNNMNMTNNNSSGGNK